MVACCSVGVSSVAAHIHIGFNQQETTSTCMQQNPSAVPSEVVDQLRHQLQLVLENDDELGALAIISSLESLVLNKEVLETTRIGATINEIRKSTAQRWPEVSKRCRGLIKKWQKLAEFNRPISSCEGSSNGATPNLVSPALKRGLTPHKRVTSTDSNSGNRGRISALGECNGSYAPKLKSISPYGPQVHKSISVGGALSSLKCSPNSILSDDGLSRDSLPIGADAASLAASGDKRKAQEESHPIKRSRTIVGKLSSVPSSNNISVVAARKDVQSTAELVAQLSENLPQSMAIDLKHEGGAEGHFSAETSPKVAPVVFYTHPSSNPTSTAINPKPKRKYTKRAAKFFRHSSSETQLSSGDTLDEEEDGEEYPQEGLPNGLSEKNLSGIAEEEPSTSTAPTRLVRGGHRPTGFDWSESIKLAKDGPGEYASPYGDLTSSVVIPIRQRHVLLLPYCDIGMPDFVEHNLPEPEQYILSREKVDPRQQQLEKN